MKRLEKVLLKFNTGIIKLFQADEVNKVLKTLTAVKIQLAETDILTVCLAF